MPSGQNSKLVQSRFLGSFFSFANADEDALVETGPFAQLYTAGAARLLANYCQWCPIFFSFKDPWCAQLVPFEFSYNNFET